MDTFLLRCTICPLVRGSCFGKKKEPDRSRENSDKGGSKSEDSESVEWRAQIQRASCLVSISTVVHDSTLALSGQTRDGSSCHQLLWHARQNRVEAFLSANYKAYSQALYWSDFQGTLTIVPFPVCGCMQKGCLDRMVRNNRIICRKWGRGMPGLIVVHNTPLRLEYVLGLQKLENID